MELLKREDFPHVIEIMTQSFPESETRTAAHQEALLENPRYKIYVHRDEVGEIDCFLAIWELANCFFWRAPGIQTIYPRKRGGQWPAQISAKWP